MLKLIINADDFGLTPGCNKGIIKAMTEGVVTSTTAMINMPAAKDGFEMAKKAGIKGMGLHLNLTCGEPISQPERVPSLILDKNHFYNRMKVLKDVMDLEDVEYELRQQLKEFKKTGIELTHIDSHHHAHMYPGVAEIVVALAKQENVPLRKANELVEEKAKQHSIITTEHFTMDFYGEKATLEGLKDIIKSKDNGVLEIMCHPATVDKQLAELSTYCQKREDELNILTSPKLKQWLKDEKIELISYEDLKYGKHH